MTNATHHHTSVLMTEVLENLSLKHDGVYVDATFGRGGHSKAILDKLGEKGRLFAMDKDPEAVAFARENFAKDKRLVIHHGSFSELSAFLKEQKVYGLVDGIFFDLGVSSPQLDTPERGFSFQSSGKLDMRMDTSKGMDAASWISKVPEQELANILFEFGEERFSRRIARSIVEQRLIAPIDTTERLASIITKAIPFKEKGKHPATRSFQAIRIAINSELDDLKQGLEQALDSLTIGGKLLVISFHSLEDRIVKQFIQNHERSDQHPPGLPIKFSEFKPRLKRYGKAIRPTDLEIHRNPRARSATLRIAEKQS